VIQQITIMVVEVFIAKEGGLLWWTKIQVDILAAEG